MTTGSGMTLEPCLEAIAAGDGINREIMQFDEERRSIVLCAIAGLFLDMPVARVGRLSAWQTDSTCVARVSHSISAGAASGYFMLAHGRIQQWRWS